MRIIKATSIAVLALAGIFAVLYSSGYLPFFQNSTIQKAQREPSSQLPVVAQPIDMAEKRENSKTLDDLFNKLESSRTADNSQSLPGSSMGGAPSLLHNGSFGLAQNASHAQNNGLEGGMNGEDNGEGIHTTVSNFMSTNGSQADLKNGTEATQNMLNNSGRVESSASAAASANATAGNVVQGMNTQEQGTQNLAASGAILGTNGTAGFTQGEHPVFQPAVPVLDAAQGKPAKDGSPRVGGKVFQPEATKRRHQPARPNRMEDRIVPFTVAQKLAQMMVNAYWPKGSYPTAKESGITTLSLKQMNNRFGVDITAFSIENENTLAARQRILDHILLPSMIDALDDNYSAAFVHEMKEFAKVREIGPAGQERPLTLAEQREMFTLYAGQMRSLGNAIKGYYATPDIRELVGRSVVLEQHAATYAKTYAEASFYGESAGQRGADSVNKRYQKAVAERELVKMQVASAIRKNGGRHSLSPDTVLYLAQWLNRRDPAQAGAMSEFAKLLLKLAGRFEVEASAAL